MPARDEAVRLGPFLDALAVQDLAGRIPVVIALNNTTDGSLEAVADAGRRHGARLSLTVDDHVFPAGEAHAGSARERAMALGLQRLGASADGVLISTDADTRPPPDWVRANLEAIARGPDLVGGRLVLDEAEPLGSEAAEVRALWDEYWVRVRAIEDDLDPLTHDPAPRHGDHTGASLAITAAAYRAAGGVPRIPSGEDRALVAAAVATGARLVHPPSVWTRVSPRQDGRASGGMASDMRRLALGSAGGAPPLAPALDHWRIRAAWRRDLRSRLGPAALVAAEAALPPMPDDTPLAQAFSQEARA
ncbi:glycosyltransferase [Brevundimonas subvibrioides]|uniref:glycosyltransferase n=1 Tax=Brevundimonas subvibrioides TaxID=74313 RepID=UPI0032D5955C